MTSKEVYKIGSDGLNYRVVPPHTKKKHDLLKIYLDIVSTAIQKKLQLVYVDLYSSNGKCIIRETDEELNGSPLIALEYPYYKYVFNDIDIEKINELRQRIQLEFPNKYSLCYFYTVDANTLFKELQKDGTIPRRHLLTVFSDPNDLAPNYNTIKYGSRLVERVISKDFQHNLVDIFMSVIEPEFTFFQMIIIRFFPDSTKFSKPGFSIAPEAFYPVNMGIPSGKFILSMVNSKVFFIPQINQSIVSTPTI